MILDSYEKFYNGRHPVHRHGPHFPVPANAELAVKANCVKEFTLRYKQYNILMRQVEFIPDEQDSNLVHVEFRGRAYLDIELRPEDAERELEELREMWEDNL
jgi:hypothetical protein